MPIIFITGPSGVGKTQLGFLLMGKIKNSIYIDSDNFCAKNPLNPLLESNIEEVYQLLYLNYQYLKKKNQIEWFIFPLFINAALFFNKYGSPFLSNDSTVHKIVLSCSEEELKKRILSRDRIEHKKKEELENTKLEINYVNELIESNAFKLIDTTGMNIEEITMTILNITDSNTSSCP